MIKISVSNNNDVNSLDKVEKSTLIFIWRECMDNMFLKDILAKVMNIFHVQLF